MNRDVIMGIDPGTNVLGFGIIAIQGKGIRLISAGSIHMSKEKNHYEKLKKVYRSLENLLDLHQPGVVSVEAPFFGKNVQSMLKLGRAQGIALGVALARNVEVVEYSPKKIKHAITGRGNSSKEQVAAMLCQILDCRLDSKFLDTTDGLAAAVCHFFQRSRPGSSRNSYQDWKHYVDGNPARLVQR
jgi:crossover junction endodeoxyribonuclease RuvC